MSMSKGIANIIFSVVPSIVAIVVVFISHWLNLRFNERQRKRDSDERFFNEMYQRRLALYEDVIKALAVMGRPEAELNKMTKQEFSDKAFVDYHTLLTFINRLRIYGSPESRGILYESSARLKVINEGLNKSRFPSVEIEVLAASFSVEPMVYIINSFVLVINEALAEFTTRVAIETEADFVDKRINAFLKDFTCKKKK